MRPTSCGIDFGTSNSAIAISDEAAAHIRLIPVEDDSPTIPSALFFATDKTTTMGAAAERAYLQGTEGRFMRSLKRVLGTGLMDQGTRVNGKRMGFDQIISLFLRRMKNGAEEQLNRPLEHVVMGRPVHFSNTDAGADDRAEAQLESIAKMVGFKHIAFQYEPIAAAFAHEAGLDREQLALVVDIGGGTSDITVIRLRPQAGGASKAGDRGKDILANAGVRVGGNDFDKQLSIHHFMPELGYGTTYGAKNLTLPRADFHDISEWSKVNLVYQSNALRYYSGLLRDAHAPDKLERFIALMEAEAGHRLLGAVEHSKIALTQQESHEQPLPYIAPELAIQVSRAGLNSAIAAEIDAIDTTITDCLKDSGVTGTEISLVILTGGSTEIPHLQDSITQRFAHAQISQDNKLSSVALGLAHDAGRIF